MPLTRQILMQLTAGRMTQAQLAAALAARGVMVLHLHYVLLHLESLGMVRSVKYGQQPCEWAITPKGELELSREAVQATLVCDQSAATTIAKACLLHSLESPTAQRAAGEA